MDQSLQRSNRIWRLIAVLSLAGVFVLAGFAFPQRDRENQPQAPQAGALSNIVTNYANFVNVSTTPEELILDFGLNTHNADQPVKISSRVVMNYYTAKRVAAGLAKLVEQHEARFGELELDVQKRIKK